MSKTVRPKIQTGALSRAFKTALRQIAEAASIYGEEQARTKAAVNRAHRWAADYAHELVTAELKSLDWQIENGNDTPQSIRSHIAQRIEANSRAARGRNGRR